MRIRQYTLNDEKQVVGLWRKVDIVRITNDPEVDIARKLKHSPELFLVAEKDGLIVGTIMIGWEGHRGWINYLGVLPEYQCTKIGTSLMKKAEEILFEKGCPKINLMIRKTNLKVRDFYKKLGFIEDEVICLGKRIV
jgi:ribosomal protein S18 acetylase RimI-like enzyme